MDHLEKTTAGFCAVVEMRREYAASVPVGNLARHASIARDYMRTVNNAVLDSQSTVPVAEMLMYLAGACAHMLLANQMAGITVAGDSRSSAQQYYAHREEQLALEDGAGLLEDGAGNGVTSNGVSSTDTSTAEPLRNA